MHVGLAEYTHEDHQGRADAQICPVTGKSLSEALILVSTNPQYDDRLFIDNYKLKTWGEHVVHTNCFLFLF